MTFQPAHVVITGASSGLGAALALRYARVGWRLALFGRDADRLREVAGACTGAAAVTTHLVEVSDQEAMAAELKLIDAQHPVEVVIANAGISAGTEGVGDDLGRAVRRIMAVNVEGVLNTVLPLLPAMAERRRGQIALMSSIAGFRGIPGSSAYSASKAAVRVLGEAWRIELAPSGIGVSVICPGYVATPMTRVNTFRMPFLQTPERAAEIIARGLERNRARIAFPWPMGLAGWCAMALPTSWTDLALKRFPRKPRAGHL